jgi:hypothetical protein
MKRIAFFVLVAATLTGGEMISVRKSEDRGHGEHGWLTSHFTFSFSDYYDPKFMGFRTLRVINEDVVAPAKGFDTHPHNDMEILTYILEGTLEHKDTMGNHSQITAGEFQLMTAGTGIQHSEFNPSKDKKVHLLQIWIQPEKKGLTPEYQQKSFTQQNGLQLIVSREGTNGSLKIHQDAKIYRGRFTAGHEEKLTFEKGRQGWIQMVSGNLSINGTTLKTGDGAALSAEPLVLSAKDPTEFILFDLK